MMTSVFFFWGSDVGFKDGGQLRFLASIKFSTITQCSGVGLILMLEELLQVTGSLL